MDIHDIIVKSADTAIQKMFNDFEHKNDFSDDYFQRAMQNIAVSNPELYSKSEDFRLMITYCNYLVEAALEEYSKQSK